MKERKKKPPSDSRFKDLLPELQSLPEELRDALVLVLGGIVKTQKFLAGDRNGEKSVG